MRVRCVKPFKTPDRGCKNDPEPKVGDVDVVVDSMIKYGNTFYKLERFKGNAYKADHFATIDPDLDETTLVNEEWEEKVCELVNQKL